MINQQLKYKIRNDSVLPASSLVGENIAGLS